MKLQGKARRHSYWHVMRVFTSVMLSTHTFTSFPHHPCTKPQAAQAALLCSSMESCRSCIQAQGMLPMITTGCQGLQLSPDRSHVQLIGQL